LRTHILSCLLAYIVEWHIGEQLLRLPINDDDPTTVPQRFAVASTHGLSIRGDKGMPGNRPVHNLRRLFDDLATVTSNRIIPRHSGAKLFDSGTRSNPLPDEAFRFPGAQP